MTFRKGHPGGSGANAVPVGGTGGSDGFPSFPQPSSGMPSGGNEGGGGQSKKDLMAAAVERAAAKAREMAQMRSVATESSQSSSSTVETAQDRMKRLNNVRPKGRFSDVNERMGVPGLPSFIPYGTAPEVQEALQVRVAIDSMGRRIQQSHFQFYSHPRDKSPPPRYDALGKKMNVREQRGKEIVMAKRHHSVMRAKEIHPRFQIPVDYRPPSFKYGRRIYVPPIEGINFIGLIIGPRGITQRQLEEETGARLVIRGRGSKKVATGPRNPEDEDPMHIYITADSEEAVEKAAKVIQKLLIPETPEHILHKTRQLRELAKINGTLSRDEAELMRQEEMARRALALGATISSVARVPVPAPMPEAAPVQPAVPLAPEQAKQLDDQYESFMKELMDGKASGSAAPPASAPAPVTAPAPAATAASAASTSTSSSSAATAASSSSATVSTTQSATASSASAAAPATAAPAGPPRPMPPMGQPQWNPYMNRMMPPPPMGMPYGRPPPYGMPPPGMPMYPPPGGNMNMPPPGMPPQWNGPPGGNVPPPPMQPWGNMPPPPMQPPPPSQPPPPPPPAAMDDSDDVDMAID